MKCKCRYVMGQCPYCGTMQTSSAPLPSAVRDAMKIDDLPISNVAKGNLAGLIVASVGKAMAEGGGS